MNLQAITAGAIGAVNPFVAASLLRSNGYTIAADGSQVPAYHAPAAVRAQVQALTNKDLKQLDGLNIQGVKRAIYLQGDVRGLSSAQGVGGDLIVFGATATPDVANTTWLVVTVLETWATWSKVGVTLQTDPPA